MNRKQRRQKKQTVTLNGRTIALTGQNAATNAVRILSDDNGIVFVKRDGGCFFRHEESKEEIRADGFNAIADKSILRGFIRKLRKQGVLSVTK